MTGRDPRTKSNWLRHATAFAGLAYVLGAAHAAFASPPGEPPGREPAVGFGPSLPDEPTAEGARPDGHFAPDGASFGDESTVTDPSNYDIADEWVVDERDEVDETSARKLFTDLNERVLLNPAVVYRPTGTEADTRAFVVDLPHGQAAELVAALTADGRVEYVEPVARVRASFTPDDPLYQKKEQWHLDRIGAPTAWDFATGRGVTVAIVDTGVACEKHGPFTKATDLAATECVAGHNFIANNEHANDDNGHGTHVAGTVAQSTNNGVGAAGVAFNARLMPVKVLAEGGWGTTVGVADGIRWAADHGAQVINLSLGGPRNSKLLQKAVDHARSKGALVIAAAGNTGGPVNYPGACEGVVAVSASDDKDQIARFSSRGKAVDIAAPGVNVVQQTICNGGKDGCERFPSYNGTSMATPHVAGAAALLMSLGVTDPSAVEATLASTARVVDAGGNGKLLYGAGVLQAADAVRHVTIVHALTRLIAVALLSAFVLRSARKKNASVSLKRAAYWVGALVAGPGLLFFAPWVFPRADLIIDAVARPLADLDLLAGVSFHRWLPLATAALPLGLAAIGLGIKAMRPFIAGIGVGTAAYLTSVMVLGDTVAPLGRALLIAWCLANAFVSLWVAKAALLDDGTR